MCGAVRGLAAIPIAILDELARGARFEAPIALPLLASVRTRYAHDNDRLSEVT